MSNIYTDKLSLVLILFGHCEILSTQHYSLALGPTETHYKMILCETLSTFCSLLLSNGSFPPSPLKENKKK